MYLIKRTKNIPTVLAIHLTFNILTQLFLELISCKFKTYVEKTHKKINLTTILLWYL